jgi:Fe-S-cluster-containing hydrogenase component 2
MRKYAIDLDRCERSPNCPVRRECPIQAIGEVDGDFYINADVCRGCGLCVRACPRGAVNESAS